MNTFQENSDKNANVFQSTTTLDTDTRFRATVDSVNTETSGYTALVDLDTITSTNTLDTDTSIRLVDLLNTDWASTDTSACTNRTEEAMDLTDSVTIVNAYTSTSTSTIVPTLVLISSHPTNTLMSMANLIDSLTIANTNISTTALTSSRPANKLMLMLMASPTDSPTTTSMHMNTNTTVFTLINMLTPTANFRVTVTST